MSGFVPFPDERDDIALSDHAGFEQRRDWLEMVNELERRMGAPMFSDSTKLQVASGLTAQEIEARFRS